MLNTNLYLILLSGSIVITYLAVRRGYAGAAGASIVGSMTNTLFAFLYSISKGNGLSQALIASLSVGIVFGLAAGIISAMFRSRALHPVTDQRALRSEVVAR